MNKYYLAVGSLASLFLFGACNKGDNGAVVPYFAEGDLVPSTAVAGVRVTLKDKNILAGKTVSLWSGTKKLTLDSISEGYLDFRVPADLALGDHNLEMEVDGQRYRIVKGLKVESVTSSLLEKIEWIGHVRPSDTRKVFALVGDRITLGPVKQLTSAMAAQLKQGVDVYLLTYKTFAKGKVQAASAVLCIPERPGTYPLLGFNHPTVASNAEVPTSIIRSIRQEIRVPALALANAVGSSTSAALGLMLNISTIYLAQAGFVVVVPDYLGFGESLELAHPYYIADIIGTDVRHAIEASHSLGAKTGRQTNNLYIAGYSEGGYVSVATQYQIEKKKISGLPLKLTIAGAGGFDLVQVEKTFLAMETYPQPYFFPFLVIGYQDYYPTNGIGNMPTLAQIFQNTFAQKIPGLFQGKKVSGPDISKQLTTKLKGDGGLLASEFVSRDPNNPGLYKGWNDAMLANSLNSIADFKPASPILFWHSSQDTYVPVANTKAAAEELKGKAQAGTAITYVEEAAGEHSGAYLVFFATVLAQLNKATARQ